MSDEGATVVNDETSSYGWAVHTAADQTVGRVRLTKEKTGWVLTSDEPIKNALPLEELVKILAPLLTENSTREAIETELIPFVQARGYRVTGIPESDISVTMVFPVDGRTPLSKAAASHDAVDHKSVAGIAAAVRNATQAAVQQVVTELQVRFEKACASQEIELALAAAHELLAFDNAAVTKVRAALLKWDRTPMTDKHRVATLDVLVGCAAVLRCFSDALPEVQEFIALTTDPEKLRQLCLVKAHGDAAQGRKESARLQYRDLVADPSAEPDVRAWSYRGLSLLSLEGSQEQLRWEERAGDSFAEAGDREQLATSYVNVARAIRHKDPKRALFLMDKVLGSFLQDDPLTLDMRASLYHTKAELYRGRGNYDEALVAITEAVRLRSQLQGNEQALAASLYLAVEVAQRAGQAAALAKFVKQAHEMDSGFGEQDAIRVRIAKAVETSDVDACREARAAAAAACMNEIVAIADIYIAMIDSSLKHCERIALIEGAGHLFGARARMSDRAIVASAYAEVYRAASDDESALKWYLRVHELTPEDQVAWRNAVKLLFDQRRWQEAVDILKVELDLRGERPGVLTYLAEALVEVGQPHEALPYLLKAQKADRQDLRSKISTLLERVAGAPVAAKQAAPKPVEFATLYDLENALSEFVQRVEADWRMQFWVIDKTSKKHKWRPKPEAHAKSLLQAFLAGSALKGSEVLEEVTAGWGRIDLYVRLAGGERIVIELKMLGSKYSSTYAAEGFEQLSHYMNSKNTNVGYLIAFDARSRDQGKDLKRGPETADKQISVLLVDLRPSREAEEPLVDDVAEN